MTKEEILDFIKSNDMSKDISGELPVDVSAIHLWAIILFTGKIKS